MLLRLNKEKNQESRNEDASKKIQREEGTEKKKLKKYC